MSDDAACGGIEVCDLEDNDCDGAIDEQLLACEFADSDQDALPDLWEVRGVDLDGDGELELDLAAMGADPLRRDLFIEVDHMQQDSDDAHSDALSNAALERVQQAFAAAPVENPDGSRGINLHIDNGPESLMDPQSGRRWGELSEASVLPHADATDYESHAALRREYMGPGRRGVFRYAVAGHGLGSLPIEGCSGILVNANGLAAKDQMIVTFSVQSGPLVELGGYTPGARDEGQQASLFMHELGHTLGLAHGGSDDINRKPNYLSVMNYSFTYRGLWRDGRWGVLDYSRFDSTLDETALSETDGLEALEQAGAEGYGTVFYCGDTDLSCMPEATGLSDARVEITDLGAPVDWNCDGRIAPGPVAAEVNLGVAAERFESGDDWRRLDFSAAARIGAWAGEFADE
ncbi:MAG: hypothetical protein OEZ06_04055 [Myxococcales bacterium]|nr:hypothetical protein [Myxococcales bacterium]